MNADDTILWTGGPAIRANTSNTASVSCFLTVDRCGQLPRVAAAMPSSPWWTVSLKAKLHPPFLKLHVWGILSQQGEKQ